MIDDHYLNFFVDVLQKDVRITIACDVDNPFVGPHGAVHTFSAQKVRKITAYDV